MKQKHLGKVRSFNFFCTQDRIKFWQGLEVFWNATDLPNRDSAEARDEL